MSRAAKTHGSRSGEGARPQPRPGPGPDPSPDPSPDGGGPPSASGTAPSLPGRPWRRRLAIGGGVAVAVLVPLLLRVTLEGGAELRAADEARARRDLDGEIEHLGRALRWRTPLAGHDEAARERLWAIGQAQEAEGDREAALAAYRELRRGLLATRVLRIPHRARWTQANERIAALMAEQERALGLPAPGGDAREAAHLALLSREPGPAPIRGHLAALCFAGWLVALAGFALRAIGPRGRLRPRPALRWGLAVLGLLVAWAVLLATAHR